MAQVFFVTSLGCAEPIYNKNTSNSPTDTKNLRIPMGFGKESFGSEATSRVTASMALQTIADGLRQGLDLGEIIEKSFDASFKKQLKAPIEIRLDPSTRVIYISYGNIYMSLNPAGVIAGSNEQEFKAAIKEVAVIKAEKKIKLADEQQPVQLSLWDAASDTAQQPQSQRSVSINKENNVVLQLKDGRTLTFGNIQRPNFIFNQKIIRWAYVQRILDLTVDRWLVSANKARNLYEYTQESDENVKKDIGDRGRLLIASMYRRNKPYVTGIKKIEAMIESWCKRNAVELPGGWVENKDKKKEQRAAYLVAQVKSWFAVAFQEDDPRLEYKLFNAKFDITGLPFWDLPILPVTEKGEIDAGLMDWMIKMTRPPEEYLTARKVSLEYLTISSFITSTNDAERKEAAHILKAFAETRASSFREYFKAASVVSENIREIDHITITVNDGIHDIAKRFGTDVKEKTEQGALVIRTAYGIEIIQPVKGHTRSQELVSFLEKRENFAAVYYVALVTREIEKTLASINQTIPSDLIIDETPRTNSFGDKIAFIHPQATQSKTLVELIEHKSSKSSSGKLVLSLPTGEISFALGSIYANLTGAKDESLDPQSLSRAIEKLRIDLLDVMRQKSLVELEDIMGDPVKFSKWLKNNLIKINHVEKYQVYLALMSYAGFIRAKSGEAIESEKAKYFEMGADIAAYGISLKPKLEDDKGQLVMLATVFIDKLNETAGTDIQRLKQAASAVRSEEVLRLELQKAYPWRYDLLRHVLGYIDQVPEDSSDIGGDITMIGSPGRFIEYLNEILELSKNKYAHVNALMERVEGKIQDELEKIEVMETQQNIPAGEAIKRVKQVNLDAEVPKGEQSKFRWLADNLDRYAGYDAILPVGSMQAMSGDLSPYEPAGWYFDLRYGNDEDLEYLIGKAREKGIDIEIVVDVVLAHTGTDSSGTALPDRCYLKNPDGTRVKVWGDKLDYTNGETLKYGIWFLRRLKKLGVRWIRCDQMGGLGSSGNLLWSAAEKLGLKMISEWENYQEVPSASIIYYKGIRNELSAWGGVSSFEKLKSMLEERLGQLPERQSALLILEDHDEQQRGPIINFIGKDKDGNYDLNKLKAYYLAVYMLQLLHYKRVAVMEHSGTGEGCATQVSFMYGAQGCVDFQDEAAKIFPEFAEFSRRVRNLAQEVISQNGRVVELPSENPFKRTIEIYLKDKKYEITIDLTGESWKADIESIELKIVDAVIASPEAQSETIRNHASWAYVRNLSPENYDANQIIMSDGKIADISLIKSLGENEKITKANKGDVIDIEGYKFYVHIEKNGQKVLISKDIIDVMSDGAVLAILSKSLSAVGFERRKNKAPLVIVSLSQSPRLFEDCTKNNFIGINQAFLKLYGNADEIQKKYLNVLLQIGLEHELRHELGVTNEFELTKIDAERVVKLCGADNINIKDFIEYLKGNNIIDEKFEKLIRLTDLVQENIKQYRSTNGQGFPNVLSGENVGAIINFMKEDPGCYIGYGDMFKISVVNKAFTMGIVDRLIPLTIRIANLVLSKYGGGIVRSGGDESALVLPSKLTPEQINNIRLELQLTIAEFLSGCYGFVKINGVSGENFTDVFDALNTDTHSLAGVYQDKDGFFLAFDRNSLYSYDLNKATGEALNKANGVLRKRGVNAKIIQDKTRKPIKIPSPRASFGIVKAANIPGQDAHANFGVSIRHAEYIRGIAKDELGLHGATHEALGALDKFDEQTIQSSGKLSANVRKNIAKKYNKLGVNLYFDQIDEAYPVVKREFLLYVIQQMLKAAIGTTILVRGPPDNFYIVTKLQDGSVRLMKIEFVYEPYGDMKERIDRLIEEAEKTGKTIDDILRQRWINGYGFKIVNEYAKEQPDHSLGNKVIFAEAEELNAVFENEQGKKSLVFLDLLILTDEISDAVNEALKTEVSVNVKVVLGAVKIEENRLTNAHECGIAIENVNNLTKRELQLDPDKSANAVNVYDENIKGVLHVILAASRAQERAKFFIILNNYYEEPILNQTDLDSYALLEGNVRGPSDREYIDMLVNKFQSGEGLIVLEKLTGELVEIAGESLETASQVAESILSRFAPGMEPFLVQYLTSILGRIAETYPQTTVALINKISEKMSLDEERPDIKSYLEGALDEIAAISPKRAILIQGLKRAYSILDGMKGLNRDKSLLLNIKPYLIEQGGIMLGVSPMGQSLRIIILYELLKEGLLEDDELQAAFLHEIMHAERGDEKIWPEIVNMDDKNLAEEKVQDIELEVDRLAAECLVLHGRDPKALIRLLEKSDAVCDTLIEGGFLQPSNDPRAIPTPPVNNRIANINIYLTERDFEEAKKLQGEAAIEALQKVIAAYLEIEKSLSNGSPLDRKMTEYIEKQLFTAREIVKRNTALLSEQALPAAATRTGI